MNENNIKIDVVGKILEGRHQGWYIYVEDDLKNTGGYLIVVFNSLNASDSSEGYDRWAEDSSTIVEMFKSAGWKVRWLDEN